MKKSNGLAYILSAVVLSFSASVFAAGAASTTTVKLDTLTGEVVDLACYMDHGAKGKKHQSCAKQCIQKGLPVGLLTDKGDVYLALAPDHEKANDLLANSAAEKITVVGTIHESSGMKSIQIQEIAKK